MRIALIDSTPKAKFYSIALLKIGSYLASQNHVCKLFADRLPKANEFDEIWITTCFTYDVKHALGIVIEAKKRAKKVKVGGIAATLLPQHFEKKGVEVTKGLIPEVEDVVPDYNLLGYDPNYSIVHSSRGCLRACGFCMVKHLEPKFIIKNQWEKNLYPAAKTILFYDNNWLAKPFDSLKEDVEKLKLLVSKKQISNIDFNQGLDCRLLTEKHAKLLEGLPIRPVRFAFDGMHEDGPYQKAVRLMIDHGFKEFMAYVLYGFNDTPADFYYRLKESVQLWQDTGIKATSFPMRYRPILEAYKAIGFNYVGKHWTKKMLQSFVSIRNSHSSAGQVSAANIKEFEYWFGENSDDFIKLLRYKNIRILSERKKTKLMWDKMGKKI